MDKAPKFTDNLESHQCRKCFMWYGLPCGFVARRRQDGVTWYCPGCGTNWSFKGSTEADELRRERDRLKQQAVCKDDELASLRREWDAAEKRAAAAERKTKSVQKRAHAALCPCCNRSFSQLARHMATKHPNFRADAVH